MTAETLLAAGRVKADVPKEKVDWLSVEEVADEMGGIPEEIRCWIQNGDVALVEAAAARAGRICEEDFHRLERHQVEVGWLTLPQHRN